MRIRTHSLMTLGRSYLDIVDYIFLLNSLVVRHKGVTTSIPIVKVGSVAHDPHLGDKLIDHH